MNRFSQTWVFSLFLTLSVSACAINPVNVKLKVVDEKNQPIADAYVAISFLLSHGANEFRGSTDSDGTVEVTRNGAFGVGVLVKKEGFYNSHYRTGYGDQNLTLLLLEKKNPTSMYAKNIKIQPQIFDKDFGYDFVEGDYVMPYGKGKISDLVLKIRYNKQDFWNYEYYLSISFTNEKDGLIPFFVANTESRYRSKYVAPLTGYQGSWEFKQISVKGKADDTNFNKNKNYYFRVRTAVNDDGEVVSAHYGKIYGEFPEMMYFFNEIPNDRNVEFDPTKNLFDNLMPEETVREP